MSEQTDLLKSVLKTVLKQGAGGAKKMGRESKRQMTLRTLNQRKQTLYQKLGKEVEQLVKQEELSHPGLDRALKHLAEVEAELESMAKVLDSESQESSEATSSSE
jgi:hypothetical protein